MAGETMPERRLDATVLREWARAALNQLIRHADEINALNVFPVADADTGTNMLFTMRSAVAEAGTVVSDDRTEVANALARGGLSGARGNSGVVLSQILLALAEEAAQPTPTARSDVELLAAALQRGGALVVAAMGGEVVEGTVVSVLAAAAAALADAAEVGAALPAGLSAAAESAASALDHTTEQLAVLAEAGVVDAGGRGLLVLLDALNETVTGEMADRRHYQPAIPAAEHASIPEVAPPEFEVMYLVQGCDGAALEELRVSLDGLGDSVALAPAAADRHSVHVHTDDAGAAVEAGMALGTVSRIRISALSAGRAAPGGWTRQRAVLAVVDGDGAQRLFSDEGACVVLPDAELVEPDNGVSADRLLRAVVDTGAAQVMVLPNGYVAAEDLVAGCTAAIGWGIDVVPLPCGSMVQGLAALAVHDPGRHAVDDGYTMARAAAGSRHGSVRIATERALTWAGACNPGDGLAIAGDEVVVVAPDAGAAAARLIDLLLSSGGELVTVLIGASAGADADTWTDLLATHVHRQHPGTEFTSYRTGHRGDVLLIGVE